MLWIQTFMKGSNLGQAIPITSPNLMWLAFNFVISDDFVPPWFIVTLFQMPTSLDPLVQIVSFMTSLQI